MFVKELYAGQRILITGGGTGLGLAMAEALAKLGAEVHICGRREAVLREAVEQLQAVGTAKAVAHSLDIRHPEAVEEMMGRIWAEHGPLSALINNAAGNFISRTQDLSVNGFHAISDIVFRGTFYVTQSAGKRWIASGQSASVLSIVVTWVQTGAPFVVSSAMSKAGVDAMTKSLAIEWGPYGIRFNAIAPGVIPTEGASQRLHPGGYDHDLSKQNPMRRLGHGADIGRLAAFLLAPDNTWINGQTITLDGGDSLANGAYYTHLQDWTDSDWQRARDRIRKRDAIDRAQSPAC
ncbi:SDR family oxidoreductase [Piscinibacter sp. XHJ-5]|uniref:SDR family oxidoreductase n=1 Tax=Piscinibacter sp. XHJ-5 TaxID=3037797 RepID=UPI0024531E3B|nr:SDR family oxidoreductase [Piscinibacter sp. XHJ-5]